MKKSLVSLIAGLLIFGFTNVAKATTIVDINARNNRYLTSPVSILLSEGSYEFTPIGVEDGGAYTAWDPWGYNTRWTNNYQVYFGQVGTEDYFFFNGGNGVIYSSAQESLSASVGSSFTLKQDTYVNFSVSDSYYSDNTGGISLLITEIPVPEPSSFVLGTMGLIGIAARRRNKKA